jgi:hypothetical protein
MNSFSLDLTSDSKISKLISWYSRGQLSWVLVPISFFIIYNKKYIKYLSYAFIAIAIIGTIDTYLVYKYLFNDSVMIYNITNTIIVIILVFTMLLHLVLLYPLINIKKYMQPNIIQYICCIFGVLTTYYLPYWPYFISKTNVIKLTILIYTISSLLYLYYLY